MENSCPTEWSKPFPNTVAVLIPVYTFLNETKYSEYIYVSFFWNLFIDLFWGEMAHEAANYQKRS